MRIKYIFVGLVVVCVGFAYSQRVSIRDWFTEVKYEEIPEAVSLADFEEKNLDQKEQRMIEDTPEKSEDSDRGSVSEPAVESIEGILQEEVTEASSINLAVPFQSQAPFAEWILPYKEACEEASLIMVDHYLRGIPLSKEQMKGEIDSLIAWQEEHFGGHVDLTTMQVQELAEAQYEYRTKIILDLSVDKINEQLRLGRPVIVPAAGRELGNPYFTAPGPLYHMLVIKGMTKDGRFITNDPGTRRGEDYLYDQDVLLSAIRDWDGDSPDGEKTGLVLYR